MRKLLAIMLLLFITSCVAFADDDPANPPDNPRAVTFELDKVGISLDQTEFYKTGSAITPAPVLTYDGSPLDAEAYPYRLEYSDNVNVGTASVTAIFESGSKSASFEILPAKPDSATITQVQNAKPNVVVTWDKISCTGFELEVSADSSFSGAAKYTLSTNVKSLGKLLDQKTYYFRVRPYNTENGRTTYGDWSTRSSKVSTTGPVGNRFSLNGEMIADKTVKYGDDYYYYNTAGIKCACTKKMWDKVKNASSKRKYLIAVDCSNNRTCVYQGKKGKWTLKYYWPCTTGAKRTPTIKGNFKVKGKVSHFGEANGYTCWYATRIKGQYYFHSVLYKPRSKSKIRDGRLGRNLSHGCIRLSLGNAKWIYKHCKRGTKIIIY